MLSKIMLIFSFYMFFSYFNKKLISLISLEFFMIVLILSFFLAGGEYIMSLFSTLNVFLIMLVLDSVLGICMLISCSRLSNKTSYLFF